MDIWFIVGIVLMVYIASAIINIIGSRVCGIKNFNTCEYKKYDVIKTKWNSDDKDDLNFQIRIIFVPVFNTVGSFIFIIALIVNSVAKIISKG